MKLSELAKKKFIITCEVSPPKGIQAERCFSEGEFLKNHVDAINVTDNQKSIMRLGSLATCHLLKERGIEPVLQITSRDRNRLALQSDLLSASLLGIQNVLLLTGDHPSLGDHPETKPVYDLDSVSLIRIASELKKGKDMKGNELEGAPDFSIGAVATPGAEPFDLHMMKLRKKVDSGVEFIQTQVVYDLEIFERFMDQAKELKVPILVGHITLKSGRMARFMNENIPGAIVPQEIINTLDDTPKRKRVEKTIEITINLLSEMKKKCQGIHLMPMGWEKHVPTIVEAIS